MVYHLAVFTLLPTYLKDFRFRLISWWAFHFVSFSLPLETALRRNFSGRKTLCFALLYLIDLRTYRGRKFFFLAQLFTNSKQRLVRFWRERSDILKRQWQNNPENRPTCEWFTCLHCHSKAVPRIYCLWFLAKISERQQYSLITSLQRRNPPFCLKLFSLFLPYFVSRVTLTDYLNPRLRTLWAWNV